MNDIQRQALDYWYAYIYEQDEDEAAMADYIARELGKRPLSVLEAACGGGKLCIPLAQAGHEVTGIDQDESMLRHLYEKSANLPNLHILCADMLAKPWGSEYDAVILGANLMVNIVTDRDYKRAQINLLERAYEALKNGGKLFIDFDCPLELSKWIPSHTERVCFDGIDDKGTSGRYIVANDTIHERSRLVTGRRRWEITPIGGPSFAHTENCYKYFPPLEQICAWLYRIGFAIESVNGGYHGEPFDRSHRRAVIWARKITL